MDLTVGGHAAGVQGRFEADRYPGCIDLDLRLLRPFVAVAEELHFGRAAERLYVTQPALSRQIRKLEQSLGVTLLERSSRRVQLTPAGEAFLAHARNAVLEADRAAAAGRAHGREPRTRLRVGYLLTAANEWTPEIVRAFEAAEPAVRVELRQYFFDDPTGGLRDGAVDVAIVRLPLDDPDLATVKLFEEPRIALVPGGHRLADAGELEMRDLADEPLIVNATSTDSWRCFWELREQRSGLPPAVGAEANSVDECLAAIALGRGIGIAPAVYQRFYDRPGVAFIPIRDAEPSVVALAWRPGAEHPLAPRFRAIALEVCAPIPR
jgi:DNA-binding transcriptional LysR family regulator